jgi:L-lactate dehydrogenase complex protein LldG
MNSKMSSRDKILEAVLKNQPPLAPLPVIPMYGADNTDLVQTYVHIFKSIGGAAFVTGSLEEAATLIETQFDLTKRTVTTLPEFGDFAEMITTRDAPHAYEDVELAIIRGQLGVAENGAVWLTESLMGQRIIPYICQHLAVILDADFIVPTLHQAYEQIGLGDYGFGGFIGGPSKTADIEQALVLGAHGPLTMTIYIIDPVQF